jgi:hypothetical protein
MSPTRTQSGARQGGMACVPKLLHLLPILLRRKLLISKRYSRYSRFSRLINSNNICSCRPCPAGTYKESARHPAEPAEPAVTLSSQWDKRSKRAAAHPDTCCAYHHRTVEAGHSSLAKLLDPESLERCAIAFLHVGTITPKVSLLLPVRTRLCRPHERCTATLLNPFTRTSRHSVGSRPTHATHRRVDGLLV